VCGIWGSWQQPWDTGETLAEVARIKIEGENKWLTLIQSAIRRSGVE